MEEKTDRLFTGFPPVSTREWEAKIKADLKGADYEKKLIWKTPEGFKVKPFYSAEDLRDLQYPESEPGRFPFVRGDKSAGNAWEIRQDFTVFDIPAAIEKARLAIENGVTSVGFDITRKGDMYYHDFRTLIRSFGFGKASLNLVAGEMAPAYMDFLLKALEELNIDTDTVRGSIDFDPMGQLATTGGFYYSEKEDFDNADRMLLAAVNELSGLRVLPVNSFLFGNAGASAVQELGIGLSMAAEYMSRLSDAGHDVTDVAQNIQWNLGVGSSYFIEIGKVRAARVLFSHLLDAFDGRNEKAVFIHSVTTSWNKTLYDAHVNMLRLTVEAMAAVLGGCNSLLVKPFDSAFREPDEFSERIARNTQAILKEEAYLDKVADPAAGSYYIESLTHSLVEHAWQHFLEIEDKGGYVKAFMTGFIGSEIKATGEHRRQMVASRRENLLGTNQYPNAQDAMKDDLVEEIAYYVPERAAEPIAEPLFMGRAAQEFEKLRLAAESSPKGRPRVFMLPYGNLAMRLARSQFSGNFFACAGYEIIDNLGFCSADEGVEKAVKAGAQVIVVCSSDEEYPEIAPEVFEKAKGKAIVVVAGAPACMDDLKKAGISEFIHMRSNVLETLKQFHHKLGIEN
jgi:methylmalonyl-CoA mutase